MEKIEKPEVNVMQTNARRKVLNTAVMQILVEKGFHDAEKDAIETLTEMMQSLLVELGRSTRATCELAGRTTPLIGDVIVAMINMGLSVKALEAFAKRSERAIIPLPPVVAPQKPLCLLQAGVKSAHPPHIPSYLPALPDPHAYVRTPTHKQPVTEYEAIREKAANQKRDMEKALTKFLCRTSETQSLFETEDNLFPLIAPKPEFPTYMTALNPTDQIFDFEELEYHYLVANRTEDMTMKPGVDDNDSGNEDGGEEGVNMRSERMENDIKPNSTINKAILENPNIDNPYLRAATLPKRAKQGKELSQLPPLALLQLLQPSSQQPPPAVASTQLPTSPPPPPPPPPSPPAQAPQTMID